MPDPTHAETTHGSHPANALAGQTSPYLLQHAHNPVRWHPWGDDAIREARERGVPIFLSIGYSTCYWCHVMERESFEHVPTAEALSRDFVCIKVDREERPDLDDLYMAATTLSTGQGGWPMSVFLEPDKLQPFFCGTYFPLEPMHGRPSFRELLSRITQAWTDNRPGILESAASLASAVQEQLGGSEEDRAAEAVVGPDELTRSVQVLLKIFDTTHGGFGGGQGPKFPQPVFAELLLDVRPMADDATRAAIDRALVTTLDAMMLGGIHDHLGGGFHRYAVDATWTVPHFEKMLYDNAQLLMLYARAAQVYANPWYARTARRTAAYLFREMTDPKLPGVNGFCSAQDAEVNAREGLSFLWTPEQFREVLTEDDAAFAVAAFGLDRGTNFQDPHHPDEAPSNVLILDGSPQSIAERLGMDIATFEARLDAVSDTLRRTRDTREQPDTDDKVLVAWNGLAIEALALAADWLDDADLAGAAARAADFVLGTHRDTKGTLLRTSRLGQAHTPAFLEDHASLTAGCLALHGCTKLDDATRARFGQAAADLAEQAFAHFAALDDGLFDTRDGQADLFVRARSMHDGAVPSGQSMMLRALVGLAERTEEETWAERAAQLLRSMSPTLAESPHGSCHAVRGLRSMLQDASRYAPWVRLGKPAADEGDEAPESDQSKAAEGGAADSTAPARALPLEIYASAERVTVTDDEPAEFFALLRLKPGYHIVAADPGPDAPKGLMPLRIGLVSGQGVAVYADYPAGEPHGVPEVGTVLVHHPIEGNEVPGHEIRIAIEKADGVGPSPGRPILGITLQPCTDTHCEPAITLELDVAIDFG